MSNIKVPKCNECNYYSHNIYVNHKNSHYCSHPKVEIMPISSKEVKTSPKWCPKRKEKE